MFLHFPFPLTRIFLSNVGVGTIDKLLSSLDFTRQPWYSLQPQFLNVVFQVYPGAWTAVLVSLDNVGIWNVRTENLDTWYLGQEVYVRVVNPEATNKTELPVPDNALYCGLLKDMQTYVTNSQPHI